MVLVSFRHAAGIRCLQQPICIVQSRFDVIVLISPVTRNNFNA
jgi:hypothetical protein